MSGPASRTVYLWVDQPINPWLCTYERTSQSNCVPVRGPVDKPFWYGYLGYSGDCRKCCERMSMELGLELSRERVCVVFRELCMCVCCLLLYDIAIFLIDWEVDPFPWCLQPMMVMWIHALTGLFWWLTKGSYANSQLCKKRKSIPRRWQELENLNSLCFVYLSIS